MASGEATGPEAPACRRRVLPLAEYVAEIHASVKHSPLDGSKVQLIPVPLFDGETEEEYEQAFVQTLPKGMKQRWKKAPWSDPVLGVRKHFARQRVNWFGREKGQEKVFLDVNKLETLALETLPRAALFMVKYVRKADFDKAACNGLFKRLKGMSRTQSYATFGTVFPPVYMPHERFESAPDCDRRFGKWLRKTKKLEATQLNGCEERARRIEFAALTTKIKQVKKVATSAATVFGKDSVTGGSTSTTAKPNCEVPLPDVTLWKRRVLPLTEYLVEVQSAQSSAGETSKQHQLNAIPVPLFERETEEAYEQAFLLTLTELERKNAALLCKGNRELRLDFAQRRVQWCTNDNDQRAFLMNVRELENLRADRLPRAALNETKYVTRASYLAHVRSGFFDRLKTMSRAETIALFRNVVPPIFMPVSDNESALQCEERFVQWLKATKNMTPDDLTSHASPQEERQCRIEFAAMTNTVKRHGTRTRGRKRANKKQKTENGSKAGGGCDGCQGRDSIEGCIACGCIKCLAAGIWLLEDKASRVSNQSSHLQPVQASDFDSKAATVEKTLQHVLLSQQHSDSWEAEILYEYEQINYQVELNENALEDAETQLAAAGISDIHETSQSRAENDELGVLIDLEIKKRDAALALLIVHLWREDLYGLRSVVSRPTATSTLGTHRVSHHKCAAVFSQIREKRSLVAKLESLQRSGERAAVVRSVLTTTHAELKHLYDHRRRELVELVRVDENLRLIIQHLLKRGI